MLVYFLLDRSEFFIAIQVRTGLLKVEKYINGKKKKEKKTQNSETKIYDQAGEKCKKLKLMKIKITINLNVEVNNQGVNQFK